MCVYIVHVAADYEVLCSAFNVVVSETALLCLESSCFKGHSHRVCLLVTSLMTHFDFMAQKSKHIVNKKDLEECVHLVLRIMLLPCTRPANARIHPFASSGTYLLATHGSNCHKQVPRGHTLKF